MLFLDGVYVERLDGCTRFRWMKAPTTAELTHLTHTIARRVGRFLERQGLLVCDAEQSYLAGEAIEAGPMDQLFGHSITYRIAVGPQAGRKVFTLQTLPADDDPFTEPLSKVAGFSLHAGVAAKADERDKLERLCRPCRYPLPEAPIVTPWGCRYCSRNIKRSLPQKTSSSTIMMGAPNTPAACAVSQALWKSASPPGERT